MNQKSQAKPPPYAPRQARWFGPNAEVIAIMMREQGVSGDPRDYAILDGSILTTCRAEYRVKSNATGDPVDVRNVDGDGFIRLGEDRQPPALLHRRQLAEHLGQETARRFWRFSRRTTS